MRINKMIIIEKMLCSFNQIFSTHSLRKCIEISLENLYVDIGGLKGYRTESNIQSVLVMVWSTKS